MLCKCLIWSRVPLQQSPRSNFKFIQGKYKKLNIGHADNSLLHVVYSIITDEEWRMQFMTETFIFICILYTHKIILLALYITWNYLTGRKLQQNVKYTSSLNAREDTLKHKSPDPENFCYSYLSESEWFLSCVSHEQSVINNCHQTPTLKDLVPLAAASSFYILTNVWQECCWQ